MIGYACKYTPLELIRALGGDPVHLNGGVESFEAADRICPGNLCSYSRALVQTVCEGGLKELVLVNCCDSIRRCYDILLAEGKLDFLFLLDLPHCANSCARQLLSGELRRFCREYAAYKGTSYDGALFRAAFGPPAQLPTEPYIAVLGARIPSDALRALGEGLPYPVVDLTCCGNRSVVKPAGVSEKFDAESYAAELMAQPPCLRMDKPRKLSPLFNDSRLTGVVYHTVAFCDYYAFEYDRLRRQRQIPILKLESDYRHAAGGQLSTRLQAFAESLGSSRTFPKVSGKGRYVAGIDSGSTTTNMVVLDMAGNRCGSATVRTGPKAALGARKALDTVLAQMGIRREALALIVATGYGRENIGFADSAVTEISCHARGAHHLNPKARTIIDIGGQDSKVIRLDENGAVDNFVMNDKCAAGTGRFLEMMARILELDLDEMGRMGQSWKKELTISSVCTVFAESEVISLIADNHTAQDIIHGLNLSVAGKTNALVHRVGGRPPYMMTGGVARNAGLVAALRQKLGETLLIAPEPDLCGAMGAALFALDNAARQRETAL